MGHRLPFHKGKCYNLHGHTYKLQVTIEGEPDKNGFVMDFGDLKKIVKETVLEKLDHALTLSKGDPLVAALQKISETQERPLQLQIMDFESTAENLSKWIYNQLREADLAVVEVILWETPTSSASYRGEEK